MKVIKRLLLVLFLMPTVSVALLRACSDEWAGYLSPFTLLVLPMLLVDGCLTGLLFRCRSSWRWTYLGATLLSFGQLLPSFPQPGWSEQELEGPSVRLVSWNVCNFHLSADTLKAAATFIRSYQPDILCLQERPHDNLLPWDSIRSTFDYPYAVKNHREDEVLNLAVCSRWPLSGLKEYYFPDSYNKFFQVDIHHPQGIIRLFNVHLQTTGTGEPFDMRDLRAFQQNAVYRNRQAGQLAAAIHRSPYPVVVCGDLNDTPLSNAYHKVSRHLSDCFREKGSGWGATYQPYGNLFRIDYMLCSSHFHVADYQLFSNAWSDHKIQYSKIHLSL